MLATFSRLSASGHYLGAASAAGLGAGFAVPSKYESRVHVADNVLTREQLGVLNNFLDPRTEIAIAKREFCYRAFGHPFFDRRITATVHLGRHRGELTDISFEGYDYPDGFPDPVVSAFSAIIADAVGLDHRPWSERRSVVEMKIRDYEVTTPSFFDPWKVHAHSFIGPFAGEWRFFSIYMINCFVTPNVDAAHFVLPFQEEELVDLMQKQETANHVAIEPAQLGATSSIPIVSGRRLFVEEYRYDPLEDPDESIVFAHGLAMRTRDEAVARRRIILIQTSA